MIEYNKQTLPYPIFERISIECHSFCNRSCAFCTRSYSQKKRPVDFMPLSLIYKVLKELSYDLKFQGRVSFHFYNEIFTDPRIMKILEFSANLGLNVYINTNGDFLTSEMVEMLNSLSVVQLNISLYDWQDDDEYVLLQNKFIDKLKLNDFINEYRFIRGGNHLGTRAGYAKHKPQPNNLPLQEKCTCVTKKLEIRYDGKAVICSHDYYGIHPIGDISKQHIFDIWYSKERMYQINQLSLGNRKEFELCSKCSDFI